MDPTMMGHSNGDRSSRRAPPLNRSNSEKASKRRKMAPACDRCRLKKIKCDANQPVCGPCGKRRDLIEGCTWHHARFRTDTQASQEHISRLEKKIEVLERRNNVRVAHEVSSGMMPTNSEISSEINLSESNKHTSHESEYGPAVAQYTPDSLAHGRVKDSADLSPSPSDEQDSAMIGSVAEADEPLGPFGSSSIGSFMTTVREVVNRGSRPSASLKNKVTSNESMTSRNVENTTTSAVKPQGDAYLLPQRAKADALMSTFWQITWPLSPVLSRKETMIRYQELWVGKLCPEDESEFLCMLNTIFALSTLLDIEANTNAQTTRAAADAFFQRARDMLVLWRGASLRRVQAFLLIALYLQATNESHQCWMFVGFAVRMAQSLGLHWPQTTERMASIQRREECRRVWNFCIQMDRILAMIYGRPSIVQQSLALHAPRPLRLDEEQLPTISTADLPSEDEPQVMDFFVQSLTLFDILSEVLEEFYDPRFKQKSASLDEHEAYFRAGLPHTRSLSILDIDQKLSKWEQSLPKHLRNYKIAHSNFYNDDYPIKTKVLVRQAVVLRQRYLHIRILSLRPILASFISFDVDNTKGLDSFGTLLARRMAHQCSIVCCKVAQEAIDIIYSNLPQERNTQPITAPWWYNIFYICSAATVLIAARLDASIVSELTEASLFESWRHALEVLKAYTRFSDSVSKLLAALRTQFDEVPSKSSQHTQMTGPGNSHGFNSVPAHTNNLENSFTSQFNLNSEDGWANYVFAGPSQFEMPYSLDNGGLPRQFDVGVFDSDEMTWLSAVPYDF